ncbi:hypothetical protein [Aeoliella mucimassa]|uniref:hypothetical protein n=1 Tax=Aeoliella mucimassa TaxID=2527972 RepID=UPI0018D4BC0C|nr:hypothetical protein [Aeoliella mucimassa]
MMTDSSIPVEMHTPVSEHRRYREFDMSDCVDFTGLRSRRVDGWNRLLARQMDATCW